MTIELTLAQLGAVVFAAVALAATDAARISRIGTAYASKKLGVSPRDLVRYDEATDGDGDDPDVEDGAAE